MDIELNKEEAMRKANEGEVRLEFPFKGYTFGFALFKHGPNNYELCMVDAASLQILMSIGTFETLNEVQNEYMYFVDAFAIAMRDIEWND